MTGTPAWSRPDGSAPAGRLVWVDVAKTLAIVLVVQYHVALHAPIVFPGLSGWAWELWSGLAQLLVPMRMPAFFLVSGILAAGAVTRPWPLLRGRFAALVWPFLLWSLLLNVVIGARGAEQPVTSIVARLPVVLQGGDGYWYLSTLALFLLICRLGRRWPGWLLGLALVAWCCASLLPEMLPEWVPGPLATNMARWALFAVWFVLGAFGRDLVLRWAGRPWWQVLLPALAVFVVGSALDLSIVTGESIGSVVLARVLSVAGVGLLVGVSVVLARLPAVAGPARYLAVRTLPIYVVHGFLVYATRLVVHEGGWVDPPPGTPPDLVVLVAIPAVVVVMVLASTSLADAVASTRFAWLFSPPSWVRGDVRSAPARG